ncbi:hypothetical protein BHU72_07540 [Desulfuribacillus stibiiarsenatis]|uniref:Uncharacterized protein n=1 Tax=Desulfuribacillus stibiiarsenatis TaxID=1390249 RepID=A0A1E5L3T7_9FIRM|nr:hypothetical protein [Desulfuribacillus stibiiarsenatis]OEH84683.1 hypothetical protein BHU72_07540 [Desulfuribacillus stibiiarsenatis]
MIDLSLHINDYGLLIIDELIEPYWPVALKLAVIHAAYSIESVKDIMINMVINLNVHNSRLSTFERDLLYIGFNCLLTHQSHEKFMLVLEELKQIHKMK